MSVAQLIVGVASLGVGGGLMIGRDRIVARHRRRSGGRRVQPAMAYLVVGVILVLGGLSQVVAALV